MLDFQEFLEGQQNIYDDNFRGKEDLVRRDGVKNWRPDGSITAGYHVSFKYGSGDSDLLAGLSKRVVASAPEGSAMFYPRRIVHTTLSDYGITPIEDFRRSEDILGDMSSAISDVLPKIRAPRIRLGNVKYNQTAVIVAGHPSEAFVDATNEVIEACGREGVELRAPWGAHTTIARFTRDVPANEMDEFFESVEGLNVDRETVMPYLDICTFAFGPTFLINESYKRFELKNS
jgi:hypothetical protein